MIRYDPDGIPYEDGYAEPPPESPGMENAVPDQPTTSGGGGGIDTSYIAQLYRDLLGREGSASEIAGHVNNPGGMLGLSEHFRTSPEYAAKHPGTSATWQDVGGRVMDLTNQFDRTDQWSGRYDIAPHEGGFERLQGFSHANLRDPNMQTLKYQFARIAQDYEPTPEGLKKLVNDPRFKANFPRATLVSGAAGDGISFDGSGNYTDVGLQFDPKSNTGKAWWWGGTTMAGGGGGAGGAGGGAAGRAGGSPVFGAGGGGGGGGFPMLDIPTFANDLGDYVPQPFVNDLGDYTPLPWNAPKPEDVKNDPMYQFRYEEGLRPVTNNLALQGLTRSSASMKALQRYGQNFASDEFGRIYDRAADTYDRTEGPRYKAYTTNLGSRLDAYKLNEGGRFDAYKTNLGTRFDTYDRAVQEATGEYAPRQRWAELQFGRDWDLYKYQNDQAYNYWRDSLNASTTGSQFGTNNP